MNPVRALVLLPIRLYQRVLSPLKPPTCRFHPTCSQYAAEAITGHGVLKGIVLGSWRILRCQPFSREGPDPVPPRDDWRRPFRKGFRDELPDLPRSVRPEGEGDPHAHGPDDPAA